MEPEHTFIPWKFTNAPRHIWENESNHKRFFQYLQTELGIKKEEDWYSHLSQFVLERYQGHGMLVHYYKGSPIAFLQSMIPHYKWLPWKFSCTPMGFWGVIDSHVRYFEWLCEELRFRIPFSFYTLSCQKVCENFGSHILVQQYNHSAEMMVRKLCPEMVWLDWIWACKKWDKWNFTKLNWFGGKESEWEVLYSEQNKNERESPQLEIEEGGGVRKREVQDLLKESVGKLIELKCHTFEFTA